MCLPGLRSFDVALHNDVSCMSLSLSVLFAYSSVHAVSHQTAHSAEQAEEHAAALAAEYARGVNEGNEAGSEATAAAAKEQVRSWGFVSCTYVSIGSC